MSKSQVGNCQDLNSGFQIPIMHLYQPLDHRSVINHIGKEFWKTGRSEVMKTKLKPSSSLKTQVKMSLIQSPVVRGF